MKRLFLIVGLLSLIVVGWLYINQKLYVNEHQSNPLKARANTPADQNDIKNGDLIFQTSLSSQSKAIQLATKSKYSHCGLVFKEGNDTYVFEAVQPIKRTPLDQWIARGQDGAYVIKRLKNADQVLTAATLEKMQQIGRQWNGKDYDLTFEWSDDKIYCSELIWKIYQRATGVEIGKPEKLGDFDLTDEVVKKKMKARYGNHIPMKETVISPAAIFESELLMTVESN